MTQDQHSQEETVRQALRRAFSLGQTYWQQADSEYTSQHRKADETAAKFRELVETTVAHLQQRPLTGREHLYDIVPPSAAEWFADSPGIANHDWRGGWDACRNRCRTLVDERLAASSPSVQNSTNGVNPSHGGQER